MKLIPARKVKTAIVPDVEYDIPAGQILHKIGNIIQNDGRTFRCIKVSPANAIFQDVHNASKVEHFSNCHDRTEQILSSGDGNEQTNINQNTDNNMAKKNTKAEGKPGKIEFIESLLNGKMTKAEIAESVVKEFKISEQTAKNTVNWTCSTFGTRNDGKIAKFKSADVAAKPAAKKSEKKPAAKKSPPKRKSAAKPAAPANITETETVETAE